MGHFRDLFNVVLKVLGTSGRRRLFEAVLIRHLQERRLWTQSHLYNREENTMYSMTISQCYALLSFVPDTFGLVMKISPAEDMLEDLRGEVHAAIASLVALCGAVWDRRPTERHERQFKIEQVAEKHFSNLEKLCEVDEDMEDKCFDGAMRAKAPKDMGPRHRSQFLINKILEKPNTHRLRELIVEQSWFWNSE